MKNRIKDFIGTLPYSAELFWAVRGSRRPWSAHYRLGGIKDVLTQSVHEVQHYAKRNAHPKKVFIFASLHYWIEQAGLIALALAGQGHKVQLSYLPFAEWDKDINRFDVRRQDLYTQDLFKPLRNVIGVIPLLPDLLRYYRRDISEYPADLLRIAKKVSRYDTMYTKQIEEIGEDDDLYIFRLRRNLPTALALQRVFEREKPDVVIVPNGTILEMGVAYQVASAMGIETVTFEFADQRERIWIAQNDEIMSHDTTALWQGLGGRDLPEKARQAMVELFSARKGARLWGDFARQWQQNPSQGASAVKEALGLDERPITLLPTNVLGDSLTLGRERITPTMADMIVGTIKHFIEHPEAQLVVRVHPGELKVHGTSMIDVIRENFKTLPENIHIVKPGDKTNTYDLVEIADLGIVFTTTVGMEMAMAGIPVIVTGKTHYANKGFTHEPADWQAYTNLLKEIVAKPATYRLTEKQMEQVWLYAYLFFFEYSLPFPWHLLWLAEDFRERPLSYVLSETGQKRYGQTFGYLVGEPLDWQARGLARLNELTTNKTELESDNDEH